VRDGALVSQFWPDAPPTKYSFPMRNVVMSGMAIGTVVVEASNTSGARMQARLALEHGKRLFLVESLVLRESWARRYAEYPGTTSSNLSTTSSTSSRRRAARSSS
jgi:DNA processing protein